MKDLLRFRPVYQERVWGGRALESLFARKLPAGPPIGESWEIVDRPEAQSVIESGQCSGLSLHVALERHGAAIMGPRWDPARRFPILVKWLDCRERLSLQVHPPAEAAAELKGEPKTENWYIAETSHGAHLLVGLKRGVTRAQFEKAITDQTVENCVHRFTVAVGDSILVQSGLVHAIDAGNVILEIQQNSDSTYRVFDWGRVGLNGKPRTLHIEESLRSILWNTFEPEPVRAAPTSGVIADCPEFRIRRVVLDDREHIHLPGGEEPRLVSVVSGKALASADTADKRPPRTWPLGRGDNVLLPYIGGFTIAAEGTAIVLVTEKFV
jgi:mannose-6-phosphate isomerase